MKSITLTRAKFKVFLELQIKYHMNWPAAYTSIPSGKVWPHAKYGYSREHQRVNVRGLSKRLDEVADINTNLRERGGKFFISNEGAFYKSDQDNSYVPFVTWKFED